VSALTKGNPEELKIIPMGIGWYAFKTAPVTSTSHTLPQKSLKQPLSENFIRYKNIPQSITHWAAEELKWQSICLASMRL
jgi:hypothetical protein